MTEWTVQVVTAGLWLRLNTPVTTLPLVVTGELQQSATAWFGGGVGGETSLLRPFLDSIAVVVCGTNRFPESVGQSFHFCWWTGVFGASDTIFRCDEGGRFGRLGFKIHVLRRICWGRFSGASEVGWEIRVLSY